MDQELFEYVVDWDRYPNFVEDEFKCSYTGTCYMSVPLMAILQSIRTELGFPLIITSGYRAVTHPVEAKKRRPGEHSFGLAADVLIYGERANRLLQCALNKGVRRFGINQKGDHNQRFIHLGVGNEYFNRFPEAIWSY